MGDGYDIQKSEDFDQVYNLEDPGPYYQQLDVADYRMPGVLADWYRTNELSLRQALGATDRPLRILDFACGYGFNGAMLLHELSTDDVYSHYRDRRWTSDDGRRGWDADAEWLLAHRRPMTGIELTGVDVASTAVAYASEVGLLHKGFSDDLTAQPPSPELADVLCTVDLVIESGAIGTLYTSCFAAMLDTITRDASVSANAADTDIDSGAGRRSGPWFLYCPRSTVDQRPLDELWRQRGYQAETVQAGARYRKPIGPHEAELIMDQTAAAGNDQQAAIRDDYLIVDVRLARPIG